MARRSSFVVDRVTETQFPSLQSSPSFELSSRLASSHTLQLLCDKASTYSYTPFLGCKIYIAVFLPI